MRPGWLVKDTPSRHEHIRVIEDGDATILRIGTHEESEEDPMEEFFSGIFGDHEEHAEKDDTTLLAQSRRILDHIWRSQDRSLNVAQASDWKFFKREM